MFGPPRIWEKVPSLVANNIRRVTDFNEVIFHNLEVIQVYYYLTKKPTKNGSGQTKKLDFGGDIDDLGDYNTSNLTGLQSSVLELLRKSKSLNGVPLSDITSSLGDRYSTDEVNNAVVALFEEGMVFSPKENYFKVTVDQK